MNTKNVFLATAIATVFLVAAVGSVSALPVCPAPGNTVITESCEIDQDWNVPAGQHGYKIGANDIIIDGNGYAIIGGGCDGVYVVGVFNYNLSLKHGYDNVIIKNLEVKNFCTGIRVAGKYDKMTKQCVINVMNNTIDKCVVHDNGNIGYSGDYSTGIDFWPCVCNSAITRCEVYNTTGKGAVTPPCQAGGMGIRLKAGCNRNSITCNYVHDNRHTGIFGKAKCRYNYAAYNTVTGNGIYDSAGSAGGITLRCKCSDHWLIEKNNATDNYGPGIYVGGSYNTVKYNTVLRNKNRTITSDIPFGNGIEVGRDDAGRYNEVYNNTACNNDAADIYGCTSGTCTGNVGDGNTANTCVGCDGVNSILTPYTCDSLVSVYYDFDKDGYYSAEPEDCVCGVGACCNPGLFNSSGAAQHCAGGVCILTPGNDPNDCVLTANVTITPETLNVKSNGEWVTAYIELPDGYKVEDIDVNTVCLGTVPAVNDTQQYGFVTDPDSYLMDHDGDGILERMVKFDRAAVVEYVGTIDYIEETGKAKLKELFVTGEVACAPFEGSDTIKVIV